MDTVPAGDIVKNFGTLNFLSTRYRPWGGNPNKQAPETITSLTYKDPVADVAAANNMDNVGHSDDWDFPTNKLPNVGWLGRVHRGTPWQTVYLKPGSIDLPTWQAWTGDNQLVTNFGQISPTLVAVATNLASIQANAMASDAYLSHPTNDWRLLDLFTTGISDSATRGQLSINQTNLAAWSAVLSGVCVLSNAPSLVGGNPVLDSRGRRSRRGRISRRRAFMTHSTPTPGRLSCRLSTTSIPCGRISRTGSSIRWAMYCPRRP